MQISWHSEDRVMLEKVSYLVVSKNNNNNRCVHTATATAATPLISAAGAESSGVTGNKSDH